MIGDDMKFLRYLPSIFIALVMVVPTLCVLSFAIGVDGEIWARLWQTRVPTLLANSLWLVLTVTIGALFLGTVLAFLVERTDLPIKNIIKPLLIAPLITPCYIIAICYINFFGMKGLGEKLFNSWGCNINFPNIYGFWGATAMLTLGTYPYVFTIVSASLSKMDARFSEAARCMGIGRVERFFRISIPLLIPAFTAGSILVALYVLSDFGVVSLLRHPTFVGTIYEQMSGRYDYSSAASLSTILIGFTLLLFIGQETLGKRRRYASLKNKSFTAKVVPLGLWKTPAIIFIVLVILMGLIIPVGVLLYWFIKSFTVSASLQIWATPMKELWRSGMNSLGLSAFVATVTVILALPLSYWSVRKPNSISGKCFSWMAQSGIALPGVLTALGLSLVFSRIAPRLSFSITALFFAFLIHFFAQGFQMTQAGLKQISEKLEESARVLGYSKIKTFWFVTRPLLTPALLVAWIFVFLSSMRELPASLLLRPAGFDPLTVKVWIAASEGFYEQAAAPALLIILLSLPLVIIMSKYSNRYEGN
ncbi:Ferric iron ABC transporter, permease protein [hydrothermal vent metagenome]|uniref:Ferric iron ABC transporter, permease protein n=1 Tax=hydrothermal vent metagenome TaxID=652676 RepID=A0A3B1D0K2_9ZZZZ